MNCSWHSQWVLIVVCARRDVFYFYYLQIFSQELYYANSGQPWGEMTTPESRTQESRKQGSRTQGIQKWGAMNECVVAEVLAALGEPAWAEGLDRHSCWNGPVCFRRRLLGATRYCREYHSCSSSVSHASLLLIVLYCCSWTRPASQLFS